MLPPTLPGLPLLGSLLAARQDRVGLFTRAARIGDVVRLHFPFQDAVLLSHPDHIRRVLIDNQGNYGKQTRGHKMLRMGLGDGLVTSEGSFWRRQRRIAQPAFHRRRIAEFGDTMVRATLEMLERWEPWVRSGDSFDLSREMMALTLRIVGECLLSTDLSDSSDDVGAALTTLLHAVIDRVGKPLAIPLPYKTPANLKLQRAIDTLDAVIHRVIAERRRGDVAADDLLTMLMTTVDEETGECMTDRQLRDELVTIVLAGHETTATALSWMFYLLSRHPAAAQGLYAEVDEVLPDGRAPTMADLPQLEYTLAAFKEAMRLYPPVWLLARSVKQEDRIGDYDIPGGYIAFFSPWIVHRDVRFWDNPEGFAPQRFRGEGIAALPKCAYLPFIAGPRQCIGNNFALMEGQLIAATILRRYRLDLEAGQTGSMLPTVTLRPKPGIRVRAIAR